MTDVQENTNSNFWVILENDKYTDIIWKLPGQGKKSIISIENRVDKFFHGKIRGKIEPKNAKTYFYFKTCNGRSS